MSLSLSNVAVLVSVRHLEVGVKKSRGMYILPIWGVVCQAFES